MYISKRSSFTSGRVPSFSRLEERPTNPAHSTMALALLSVAPKLNLSPPPNPQARKT